jgi:hypothetical protein
VNEWEDVFFQVISQKHRFSEIGKAAREKVIQQYTFKSNAQKYNEFLNRVFSDNISS